MSGFTKGQKVIFIVRNPRTGTTTDLKGTVTNPSPDRGRISVENEAKQQFRPFAKHCRAA